MSAFDDCTAAVDAEQGAKVAADMQASEISKQKFHDAQREKTGPSLCVLGRVSSGLLHRGSVRLIHAPLCCCSVSAADRALAQRLANELRR
jgi:hypothetical protein